MDFPLYDSELTDLEAHVESGHTTMNNLCRGCLEAEGRRKIHRTVKDVDKAITLTSLGLFFPPMTTTLTYFLVGVFRLHS